MWFRKRKTLNKIIVILIELDFLLKLDLALLFKSVKRNLITITKIKL